jgi:mitochondrial chaperone BCS1
MFEWLKHALETNAIFSGGFALSIFGGVMAFLYRVPAIIWPIFRRTFITRLEFGNEDPAYQWILAWLSHQPYLETSRHIRVLSSVDDPDERNHSGQTRKPLFSIPAGLHWFTYRGRLVWITLTKARVSGMVQRNSLVFSEEITISSLFAPHSFIKDLVQEAKLLYENQDSSTISLYIPDYWQDTWKKLSSRPMRPLNSLVYNRDDGQKVLKDLQGFSESQAWYTSMGIPWRRGYLFHGIPGGGKTALIMALAGELKRDIYILNLSLPELSDDGLIRFLNSIPSGAFVLMEEVDCLFDGRISRNEKQALTFAGLLAALDGVASAEGRVLFMTTNHFDKLDPALTRAGRADVHVEFTYASPKQISELIHKFFPDRSLQEISNHVHANGVAERQLSMATLQELLVSYRENYEGALEALDAA